MADAPRFRPLTPDALADEVLARCLAAPAGGVALRVAVDGADAARPDLLADLVAARLRAAGRAPLRVSAVDFLRPASLRLEHGREDPTSYQQDWVDHGALAREVLDPLGPGGAGTWLPRLWDAARDRSAREPVRPAAAGSVLLLDGPMLLGRGHPLDLVVHLHLSAGALRRLTPDADGWTVPALLEHEDATGTDDAADLLVRAEHADRPALRVG
ncbi:hypothetical protein GCM10027047_17070 [Rhodococcus aerolatus]